MADYQLEYARFFYWGVHLWFNNKRSWLAERSL